MEPDTQNGRFPGFVALREQRQDQSGEHVTAAGRGHSRIAGSVEKLPAAWESDHRVMAFEHQDYRVALRKRLGTF